MKRIMITLFLVCTVLGMQAQEKKRLTDSEIFKTPAGVLTPAAVPIEFTDNGHILYSKGSDYFEYDIKAGVSHMAKAPEKVVHVMPALVEGWVNPTYSPDSTHIAYTLGNDLYSIDVETKEIVRHTYDGSDVILNGYASWVYYEEIFGRPSKYRAFWWSPDGEVIAYYRFDNSEVPVFPIYSPKGHYGSLNNTRYPKAGDKNPDVKIGFVSVHGGETVWADFDSSLDQYFGTPFWSGDGKRLMVSWMDRAQDNFELFSVNPFDGQMFSVYGEHRDSWIDWMDGMLFTSEGMYMAREVDGWQQVCFLNYRGTEYKRLTDGHNWAMTLLKVDGKYVYYTAKCEASTRYDIYRVRITGGKVERISYGDLNFASVKISPDGKNVCAVASNVRTPSQLVNISLGNNVFTSTATSLKLKAPVVSVIDDCKGPEFDNYALALPEIITVTMRDGLELPARVIWPVDLDSTKKYPVKVNIYGGPDNPQVSDRWAGVSFNTQWWANHGVIQVVLDNRASGHLGKAGVETAYRHLGTAEIDDFVDGISHFRKMPFVNPAKVGVEGFSFGGTMTTLCVTVAGEYFPYGIAGGGVYDWALYDSHYTERYMDRPQDNAEGYAASLVLDRVGNYKGDDTNMLRLTHGTGDDNVHFQNTLQLVDKLQSLHKDFELMIYPDGMHGYRGDQAIQSDLQDYKFWYRYLLDSPLPESLREYFK